MMNRVRVFISSTVSIVVMVLFAALAATPLLAKDAFPRPAGAVNDFAGVIPSDKKAQMENLSREVLEKTGTAIVVAVVPTLGGNEVNDYVNRLYSSWGIGKKGEDKGVLIFVAVQERKMRIETGYGVEGILPDGLVGEIRDRYIIPFLRKGDYGQGLLNGVTAIATIVAKSAGVALTGRPAMAQPRAGKQEREGVINPWTIVAVVVVLAFLFGSRQGREILPFLIGYILGGGGRGGSGGGFGGGGFGGFGGGGFGGFGGGSSGGGGAGGDF